MSFTEIVLEVSSVVVFSLVSFLSISSEDSSSLYLQEPSSIVASGLKFNELGSVQPLISPALYFNSEDTISLFLSCNVFKRVCTLSNVSISSFVRILLSVISLLGRYLSITSINLVLLTSSSIDEDNSRVNGFVSF